MKSKKFDLVKNYYNSGLWSMKKVRNAVVKEWITEEEFEEIIGEPEEENLSENR